MSGRPASGTRLGTMDLEPSLDAACLRFADRPAITFAGTTLTYRDVRAKVLALAGAYRRLGVGPGDRVICQLPDCPEHIVAINAAWAVGAVHVGADNDLTGAELSSLVGWTGAAAMVFSPRAGDEDGLAPLHTVQRDHPGTAMVLHGADHVDGTHALSDLLGPGGPSAPSAEPQIGPDDTALLFLTSGTTGRPKGIMETLPNCWAKMQFFVDAFGPGPDDVHLIYLPIAHVFGLRLALLSLLSGGRLVLLDRFSPEQALRLVGEEGVTVLPGMPTHFRLLLSGLDPARHQVGSLRWGITAASNLPRPLAEQIYERLGVELLYVYGCSEGFTTETTDRDEILRGSVGSLVFRGPPGTPPDGTVWAVDPATGVRLGPGEVGEIVFGAARPVRYWQAPEVAADGVYHTGDLGRVDPDGCVVVLGRLKELVNRGGLHVSPAEVETELARHPAVADAAVVGTPDPVLGEAICACVVCGGADQPDLAGVRTFLSRSLARHKLPDELCIVERIPRTNIGKVDRPALAALVGGGDVHTERLRPR